MFEQLLTPDNLHLSEVKNALKVPLRCAINCTNDLNLEVADYVRGSLSKNTRDAYTCDLAHFEAWGGTIPSDPHTVATYLAEYAGHLAVATLVRRLAAIARAHQALGFDSPAKAEVVRATLRGIKRRWGIAQKEAKPLTKEDLFVILDSMGEGVKDVRDRALLLIGFAGGFRRSELVALDWADIEHVRQGLLLTIRRSKTDQEGSGRQIGVPHGRTRHCPVAALNDWLAHSVIIAGPVFRPIDRHGRIGSGRLSGEAVSSIVKTRVGEFGLDNAGYSGHSLRAGLATSAATAGVPAWKIREQTGHASEVALGRYIRKANLFGHNAAGALL